jgi:hypothetical protein
VISVMMTSLMKVMLTMMLMMLMMATVVPIYYQSVSITHAAVASHTPLPSDGAGSGKCVPHPHAQAIVY